MKAEANWAMYRGCLEWSQAPHTTSELSMEEAHRLRRAFRAQIMRWPTEFDRTEPSEWYYIIKNSYLGLNEFSKKTRNQCRRGSQYIEVAPIDLSSMLEHAYPIYCKAISRYKTPLKPEAPDAFNDRIVHQFSDSNFDFWGLWSRAEKRPIGFAKLMKNSNSAHIVEIKIDPEYLSNYPSYALFPTLLDHYLNFCQFTYISNGTRSIEHTTNIQELLFNKFNFRKAYCRLHFLGSPIILFIISCFYPFRKLIKLFRKLKIFRILHILIEMRRISIQSTL